MTDSLRPSMPYEPKPEAPQGSWALWVKQEWEKLRPIVVALVLLIVRYEASAVDDVCGIDTDLNGSVDSWCTGIFNCTDEDRDGYCTNGLGPRSGVDCNDRDFFDHPGGFYGTNSGCTGNQSKVCNPDGTYTACQNFCPSTALRCFYIDPVSGNDTTGNGTWANPWKTSANFSDATTPPGTAITRQPGDWFIYKGSPTFGDTVSKDGRNVGINLGPTNDGTEANPIGIAGSPGYWPIFDSTGSASFVAINNGGSDYKIIGFKIQNSICNGYTNSVCVANDGGTRVEFANLIFTDNSGDDNTAGMMHHTAVDSTAHHFIIKNQTQSGAGNDDNTALYLGYRGTNTTVNDFFLSHATNPGGRETFKIKHSGYLDTTTAERFAVKNGQMQFAGRRTTIRNGLLLDSSMAFNNPGGVSFTGEETMQYITVKNSDSHFLSIAGYLDYDIDGTGSADRCSSDYTMVSNVFRDSIVQDSDSSYVNQDDRFMFAGVYDGEPMLNEVVSSISLLNNVFYNPNTAPSFGLFESSDANVTCAGRGPVGAAYSLAGLAAVNQVGGGTLAVPTTGSVIQDPAFSALNVGTCASCSGKGWNANWGTAGGGSTSRRKGQFRKSGRKGA